MANILGTLISDLIVPNAILQGEILPDLLGDDIIEALDGDDAVAASAGNDSILGGSGDDQLFGNSGEDTIEGNSGNDSIAGGRDSDRIFGGQGNDVIFGNIGEDALRGGDGNETMYGGKNNDILQGEDGDDILIGDFGADTMNGGGGDDVFVLGRRPNNPDGASTGGLSADVADVLQDFRERGNDIISLEGGITFADLEFTDDANGDAVIRDASGSGEILATVQGKTAAELQANPAWFQPFGGGGGGGVPTALADLEVTKTVRDLSLLTPYNPGDTIEYVVTVNNASPGTATNVQLTDELPTGVTFTRATTAQGVYNSTTGVWNIGNVDSGSPAVLFIEATINAGATGTIVNTAAGLTATQADPDPTDNAASISFTIGGGVADAIAPTAPKLVGAEILVADQAGEIGTVQATDNVGVTGFGIAKVTNSFGAIIDPAAVTLFTVDATGTLSLTAEGETYLNSLGSDFYNVQIVATDAAGNPSTAGTVKVYADIAAAINDAEIGNGTDISDGTGQDAVSVAPGVYSVGNLPITKSVDLRGFNFDKDGTDASRRPEAEIRGVLNVDASDVTIDGFRFGVTGQVDVDNAGNNVRIESNVFDSTGATAITAPTALGPVKDNLRIERNLIRNLGTAATVDGINLSGVSNLQIRDNTIQGVGGDGIQLVSRIGNTGTALPGKNVVSGNTILSSGQSGIQLGQEGAAATTLDISNVVLQNNTILGANAGDTITEGGITLSNNSGAATLGYDDLQIIRNDVRGAGVGALTVVAGSVFTSAEATIRNNVFDDRDGGNVPAVAAVPVPAPLGGSYSIFHNLAVPLTSDNNMLADTSALIPNNLTGTLVPTNIGGAGAAQVVVAL